jgi:DNA-binding transcriptional ArsR family regulator
MPQRDALELLNYRGATTPVLQGLSCKGDNPKTYLVCEVEERAAKYATVGEIALAMGVRPQTVYQHLLNAGEVDELPGLWRRSLLQDTGIIHAATLA